MKRHDAIRIDRLIQQAIEDSGNKAAYDAQRICYLWPQVVGPTINRHTTARWVVRDELHVSIASGPMKSEIAFAETAIVARLNELAGFTENPLIRRLIVH